MRGLFFASSTVLLIEFYKICSLKMIAVKYVVFLNSYNLRFRTVLLKFLELLKQGKQDFLAADIH